MPRAGWRITSLPEREIAEPDIKANTSWPVRRGRLEDLLVSKSQVDPSL